MNKDQAWFWEPEWQIGEAEATAQAEQGDGEVFFSGEGFLESLTPSPAEGDGGLA